MRRSIAYTLIFVVVVFLILALGQWPQRRSTVTREEMAAKRLQEVVEAVRVEFAGWPDPKAATVNEVIELLTNKHGKGFFSEPLYGERIFINNDASIWTSTATDDRVIAYCTIRSYSNDDCVVVMRANGKDSLVTGEFVNRLKGLHWPPK